MDNNAIHVLLLSPTVYYVVELPPVLNAAQDLILLLELAPIPPVSTKPTATPVHQLTQQFVHNVNQDLPYQEVTVSQQHVPTDS